MGGNKCRVASLELLFLEVFQYNLCIDGNMLKPVPPDFVMEYNLYYCLSLKYETFSFPTQTSDITSPLFLRFVNLCRPFVGKSFGRQRLYRSSLISAYTVAKNVVKCP